MLASVGSVGDCFDNALAESFVDSYKTELIADPGSGSGRPTVTDLRHVQTLARRFGAITLTDI